MEAVSEKGPISTLIPPPLSIYRTKKLAARTMVFPIYPLSQSKAPLGKIGPFRGLAIFSLRSRKTFSGFGENGAHVLI